MTNKKEVAQARMKCMTKILLKILKFFFSREREIAPGIFYWGNYVYENRNKPTTPPPLKLKKSND